MIFIGDVHGNFKEYLKLRSNFDQTFQLGDMGLGFPDSMDISVIPFDDNHRFIRGNHDNPAIINSHPNCLIDWGYLEQMDLFYVSGGYSIDHMYRIVDIDMWKDEELSNESLDNAYKMYCEVKPKYVISHEAPSIFVQEFFHGRMRIIHTRTKNVLNNMFSYYQPEYWVFGHYHMNKLDRVGRTKVAAVRDVYPVSVIGESIGAATYEISGLKWK